MIRVKMTEKLNSKCVSTIVTCDECSKSVVWESTRFKHFVGIALSKSILRKEGWKFGRVHRCSKCSKSILM